MQRLLDTLVEITHLAYEQAKYRSPRQILRLHNQSFLHAMWCKEIIGKKPKSLTKRKFYGKYYHSLTSHAPIVQRIISLSSIHTEEEERTFSTVKSIAEGTTSRRHEEIITPTLVRLQAESNFKEKEDSSFKKQDSFISKLASTLPQAENSIIPHRFLLKYPEEYQAHLERISDFLHCGENIWWSRNIRGVIFHDAPTEPHRRQEGPVLHHYRSSNLKAVQGYLRDMWKKCLEDAVTIPHVKLKVTTQLDDGTFKETEFDTNYFSDDCDDDDDVQGSNDNDRVDGYDNQHPLGLVGRVGHLIMEEQQKNKDEEEHEDEGDEGEGDGEDEEEVDNEGECEDNAGELEEIGFLPDEKDENIESDSEEHHEDSICNKSSSNISVSIISNLDSCTSLKTELARNISKLLDDQTLVKSLDKTRTEWKSYASKKRKNENNTSSIQFQNYMNVLAKVQTKVLSLHDPLRDNLKHWDEQFFIEHNREPLKEDYKNNPTVYTSLKKLTLCKELLKHWNITLHLN